MGVFFTPIASPIAQRQGRILRGQRARRSGRPALKTPVTSGRLPKRLEEVPGSLHVVVRVAGLSEAIVAKASTIGLQPLEATGPDCETPRVVELLERLCVVAAEGQDAFDLKAWGTDRIDQDRGLLESLMGVSLKAFLSRYGAEARYDVRGGDKGPSYLWMLYLLPEGMEPSSGYASVTLPAGTYVQANYCGPWGGVRQAYDRVWAWAAERSSRSKGPGTSSAASPRSTTAPRATCTAAGSPFWSIHRVRSERPERRLRPGQGRGAPPAGSAPTTLVARLSPADARAVTDLSPTPWECGTCARVNSGVLQPSGARRGSATGTCPGPWP